MGFEELSQPKIWSFQNLSAGWFPGKEIEEIPGVLDDPTQPTGAADCDNVYYRSGNLWMLFGYATMNNGGTGTVNGMYYSTVLSDMIGITGVPVPAAVTIYRDFDGTPTDITGALVLTPGLRYRWADYQSGATRYVIGVNGTDAPIRINPAGNAVALAGSPPSAQWVAQFSERTWLANYSGNAEVLRYSNVRDPETWTSTNFFRANAPITGLGVLGQQLVVFQRRQIAVLSGFGLDSWQWIPDYITSVGCVSGYSVTNATMLQGGIEKDVLLFLSDDGIYAFDGTPNPIKLSYGIERKFTGEGNTTTWNKSLMHKAVGDFWPSMDWYVLAVPDGGATTNTILLMIDTSRLVESGGRVMAPVWRSTAQTISALTVNRDSSNNDVLAFGTTSDAKPRAYSKTVYTRDTTGLYNASFQSKWYDPQQSWVLKEYAVMCEPATGASLKCYINADLQVGDGEMDLVSLATNADLLGSTFVLGTSVLGDDAFVNTAVDVVQYGRFLQWKLAMDRSTGDEADTFQLHQLDLLVNAIGRRPVGP